MSDRPVSGLIGVYDANGGLLGEAAYVWGKVRGTRHCALCEITHGKLRRKPAWDRMVADLGLPMELLHLNELPPPVHEAVAAHGAPIVLVKSGDTVSPLVLANELDELEGSVARLGELLGSRLAADLR